MTLRPLLFFVALPCLTLWYGAQLIVAGYLGVRHRAGGVYDRAPRQWARALLRFAGTPVTVSGVEHLLPQGPQIVMANHQSLFDILAILGVLPAASKFVSKKELFGVPVFGRAIKAAGHIRLDRQNRTQAFAAYELAAAHIRRGLTAVVFPEGTRTRTGELQQFKKGPFVLAIQAGVPIVPMLISGTFDIQPKGSRWIRPRPIHLAVGAPISPVGLTYDDREELMRRVRQAMEALRR